MCPTTALGTQRAGSVRFVLVRKPIETLNKVCARRGSWGSAYGQEFDSPHLHQKYKGDIRKNVLMSLIFMFTGTFYISFDDSKSITLPGFKIRFGSMALFMVFINSSSTGSVYFSIYLSRFRPMPCSPDNRPPRL